MSELNKPTRATDEATAKSPRVAGFFAATGSKARERIETPHSEKFRTATATLVGIAIIALILAGALIATGRQGGEGLAWSSWSPPDNGIQGATDIADQISFPYRQTAASQLDVVSVVSLANPNTTGTSAGAGSGLEVAVHTGPQASDLSLLTGKTIAYEMCGVGGKACALPGPPSVALDLLLRRQALELALYTFKYVSGTENVVAILPPAEVSQTSILTPKPPTAHSSASTASTQNVAMVFDRQQLQPWLDQPLEYTLDPLPPTAQPTELATWYKGAEAGLVDQITARSLFTDTIKQEEDGSNLLILTGLPTS
jgi:hypothetical protein